MTEDDGRPQGVGPVDGLVGDDACLLDPGLSDEGGDQQQRASA
ncbi:hypothetical protein ACFY3U_16205 [Micromonospora sp. NPDC000089]